MFEWGVKGTTCFHLLMEHCVLWWQHLKVTSSQRLGSGVFSSLSNWGQWGGHAESSSGTCPSATLTAATSPCQDILGRMDGSHPIPSHLSWDAPSVTGVLGCGSLVPLNWCQSDKIMPTFDCLCTVMEIFCSFLGVQRIMALYKQCLLEVFSSSFPHAITVHQFSQLYFLQLVSELRLTPLPLFNFFVMYCILWYGFCTAKTQQNPSS